MMQAHDNQIVIAATNGRYMTAYTVVDHPGDLDAAMARAEVFYRHHNPEALPVRALSWDQFLVEQRQHMLDMVKVEEIDEDRFFEALEEMPPLNWHHRNGIESFICLEATYNTWHQQYARTGDRFITKLVDRSDVSTWITREDFDHAAH